MSMQNATVKSPEPLSRANEAPRPPPTLRLALSGPRAKTLLELRAGECRYCVADTPEGRMDRALFCAAASTEGAYCPPHARACRMPSQLDLDALAAEIEAALLSPTD
jgi:hypothetical protein